MAGSTAAAGRWQGTQNRDTRRDERSVTTLQQPRTSRVAGQGAAEQAVVDGALLLPRALVATRALLGRQGTRAYRTAFPIHGTAFPGHRSDAARPDTQLGEATPTTTPARVATHVALGLLLGLLAAAAVAALVVALTRSALLLAPAGILTLALLGALGTLHSWATRHLLDRP